jgi:hypothetical protein
LDKRVWQINDELNKYHLKIYFKYKLVPPQIFKDQIVEIAFDTLINRLSVYSFDSSIDREKIIFRHLLLIQESN